MAQIVEALKGAQVELAQLPPVQRMQRAALYCRIIGSELIGTLSAVPFALRAMLLYRSLPEALAHGSRSRPPEVISLARDVRYGPRDRNLLDVYVPAVARVACDNETTTHEKSLFSNPENPTNKNPVVLFCHGGTWVAGDRWHYAMLATRLAQAGIVTGIMSYSLYPTANIPAMAAEVSRALTWTFDNIAKLGGDPENVALVGHSAGAQLVSMACLRRAAAGGEEVARTCTSNSLAMNSKANVEQRHVAEDVQQQKRVDELWGWEEEEKEDARMPARVICLAGVYDLASHYEYERGRDVHELSTMARACGGVDDLPVNSPLAIVTAAAREARDDRFEAADAGNSPSAPRASLEPFVRELKPSYSITAVHKGGATEDENRFHGDVIARRCGLLQPRRHRSPSTTPRVPYLSLEAVRRLPPMVLMHGCGDVVVPWYESAEYYNALRDCGVPARCLLYGQNSQKQGGWVDHADWVTAMKPLATVGTQTPEQDALMDDLPDFSVDFVRLASGRAPLV